MELLLVFPVFFVVVLLAVEFGVWMYQNVTISNAVRDAARFGSVNCGDGSCTVDEIKQRVVDRSNGAVALGDVTVTWVTRGTATAGQKGSSVAVNARRNYAPIFLPAGVGFTWPIGSCSEMRLERNDTGTIVSGSGC